MAREKKVDDAEEEGNKRMSDITENEAAEELPPEPAPQQKEGLTEDKVIRTIVLGSDWQEALTQLVTEEGLNPEDVDLIRLTDSFLVYLHKLQTFDFRIPARFILIAAILLRMKTELLLEEEERKALQEKVVEPLNIDVPLLTPPAIRKPTRKVTLTELITALNKAFEFKEKKETKELRMRGAIENLIEKPREDIETKIKKIYAVILQKKRLAFTDLVPVWKRKEIIDTFMPLLYLDQRGMVVCEQDDMFKEIYISLKIGETKI
ncbi:MAG: segregation/condensation protein A [Candidatus Aenigmarchaeota archaeon]|nr:segregation/condensation protein A [Candidatus Aenigmarchaeota archaeon]